MPLKQLKIYLCSRYGRRKEMLRRKAVIEKELGCVVTSRWIEGSHNIQGLEPSSYGKIEKATGTSLPTDAARKVAKFDLSDLRNSDVIICFTESTSSKFARGGRHVEFGLALGTNYMRIIVVGPTENVFYALEHENLLHIPKWNTTAIKQFLEGIKYSRTEIMSSGLERQKRIFTGRD